MGRIQLYSSNSRLGYSYGISRRDAFRSVRKFGIRFSGAFLRNISPTTYIIWLPAATYTAGRRGYIDVYKGFLYKLLRSLVSRE